MSAKMLAEATDIAPAYLSQIETGGMGRSKPCGRSRKR
ncbi:helix-turn-helix domain-containing protein [Phyllobacterium phragmitis]|nr:helix-turn-helix domain-containing protein [Phyllobacterium phragmitis]